MPFGNRHFKQRREDDRSLSIPPKEAERTDQEIWHRRTKQSTEKRSRYHSGRCGLLDTNASNVFSSPADDNEPRSSHSHVTGSKQSGSHRQHSCPS